MKELIFATILILVAFSSLFYRRQNIGFGVQETLKLSHYQSRDLDKALTAVLREIH